MGWLSWVRPVAGTVWSGIKWVGKHLAKPVGHVLVELGAAAMTPEYGFTAANMARLAGHAFVSSLGGQEPSMPYEQSHNVTYEPAGRYQEPVAGRPYRGPNGYS